MGEQGPTSSFFAAASSSTDQSSFALPQTLSVSAASSSRDVAGRDAHGASQSLSGDLMKMAVSSSDATLPLVRSHADPGIDDDVPRVIHDDDRSWHRDVVFRSVIFVRITMHSE